MRYLLADKSAAFKKMEQRSCQVKAAQALLASKAALIASETSFCPPS